MAHANSVKNRREGNAGIPRKLCAFLLRILRIVTHLIGNPLPQVLLRFDTQGLGTQMTLCIQRNGEIHRGLKELQINLRVIQTQEVSAAKGYGQGLPRSA